MNDDDASGSESKDRSLIGPARYAALGFEFAGTVVVGVLVGYEIDERLGTAPLFTLLLTMGGMGGALFRLLWGLRKVSSRSGDDD